MPTEPATSGGVKGAFTKRIGPLPVWGWGAVIVGAGGIFLIIRSHKGAAATGTQQDTLGFGNTGLVGGGGGSGSTTPSAPVAKPGQPPFHSLKPPTHTGGAPYDDPRPKTPVAPTPKEILDNTLPAGRTFNEATGQWDTHGYISDVARSMAATIEFASQQVAQSPTAIAFTPGINTGQARDQVVNALTARGYTAGSYGGQIYAAKDSTTFFNTIPTRARNDLARLLVALHNQGKL